MSRHVFSLALVLAMLACGVVLVLLIQSAPMTVTRPGTVYAQDIAGRDIYVGQGNLLEGIFREPYEAAIFIYDDYSFITWTTRDDNAVGGTTGMVCEYLAKIGKPIQLVQAMIHNHSTPHRFSERDRRTYFLYREDGFSGLYGIYYSFNKSILWWKEN